MNRNKQKKRLERRKPLMHYSTALRFRTVFIYSSTVYSIHSPDDNYSQLHVAPVWRRRCHCDGYDSVLNYR